MANIMSAYINPAIDLNISKIRWTSFLAIFTAAAVTLPYICHQFGIAGMVFLPIHFAVMIAAAVIGTRGGIAVALVSPVLSFAISGMPPAHSLFPMTIELMTYATVISLLSNKLRAPLIVSLAVAMIAGRFVSLVIVSAILESTPIAVQMKNIFIIAIPGIAIQLALVPPMAAKIRKFLAS